MHSLNTLHDLKLQHWLNEPDLTEGPLVWFLDSAEEKVVPSLNRVLRNTQYLPSSLRVYGLWSFRTFNKKGEMFKLP